MKKLIITIAIATAFIGCSKDEINRPLSNDDVYYFLAGGTWFIDEPLNVFCENENSVLQFRTTDRIYYFNTRYFESCHTEAHMIPGKAKIVNGDIIFDIPDIEQLNGTWKVLNYSISEKQDPSGYIYDYMSLTISNGTDEKRLWAKVY